MCILAGLVFVFESCVTTHATKEETLSEGKAAVSCAENDGLGTKYYAVVSCTFENKSEDWLEYQVESVKVDNNILLTATQTKDYVVASSLKLEAFKHNMNLALVTVAVAGLGVMASAVDRRVADAGLGVAAGAAAYSVGRDVKQNVDGKQYGSIAYGEDHILGGPFNVPAGLYLRKSFVVQKDKKLAQISKASICFKKPVMECSSFDLQPVRAKRPGEK